MNRVIYTAHSKHNYYAKQFVSAYVLKRGKMPLNPFMNWDYFLDDLVERELVHQANKRLIELSDEVWQFGEISNGCYHELKMAMRRRMPLRFFTLGGGIDLIYEIEDLDELKFEDEIASEVDVEEFREKLKAYKNLV